MHSNLTRYANTTVVVAGSNVQPPLQTYGHPRQERLLVVRASSFFILEDVRRKLILAPGPQIPTTNGANGQNVEDALLRLIYQDHILKKSKSGKKSGGGVQERIRTVPAVIGRTGKVDPTTIAKTTRGTEIGTTDGAVLRARCSDNGRRAWNKHLRVLRRNPATTNGLKNPALVASWGPLLSQPRPLPR